MMTGEELGALLKLLYGSHKGWATRAGAEMELHPSTIQKWIAGNRVPRLAELAVQYLRYRRSMPNGRMKLLPAPQLFVEGVAEIEGAVPEPPLAPHTERVMSALGRRQRTRWP